MALEHDPVITFPTKAYCSMTFKGTGLPKLETAILQIQQQVLQPNNTTITQLLGVV